MIQLILHLFGDYIFQSDWMANNKTINSFACFYHCVTYIFPFVVYITALKVTGHIQFSLSTVVALNVIFLTHFLIDRFRLAKYICYFKNFIAPESAVFEKPAFEVAFGDEDGIVEKYRWENCQANGYPSETPIWLSTWLVIIADNTLHLTINYFALRFL